MITIRSGPWILNPAVSFGYRGEGSITGIGPLWLCQRSFEHRVDISSLLGVFWHETFLGSVVPYIGLCNHITLSDMGINSREGLHLDHITTALAVLMVVGLQKNSIQNPSQLWIVNYVGGGAYGLLGHARW
jgi:NAD/NADP transhydrogenase beta subunit